MAVKGRRVVEKEEEHYETNLKLMAKDYDKWNRELRIDKEKVKKGYNMKLNEAKVEVKNLKMQIDTMEKIFSRLLEILKVKDEISKKVQRQLKEKEREMEEIVAQKEEEIGELNRNVKSKEEDVNEMWRIVIEKEEINYDLSLKLVAKENEMLILKEILIEKELAVQNRQIDQNKSEIRQVVNPTEDQIVIVGSETKDDLTQMNTDEIAVKDGKT